MKCMSVELMKRVGNITTHPLNIVLDALDDYVSPSYEVLDNRQ